MTNPERYERCRAAIHCHPDQMRARVLSILFEHFDQEVAAQDVAAAIGTTPMFGARGGEPCGVHHVMAKMTLGYLQNRLYRMTDYRIVVDIKRSAIRVTTKEKAAGVKTHVFRFTNFTGHDPRKDIRVDEQSRYLDETHRPPTTSPQEPPDHGEAAQTPVENGLLDLVGKLEGMAKTLLASTHELKTLLARRLE